MVRSLQARRRLRVAGMDRGNHPSEIGRQAAEQQDRGTATAFPTPPERLRDMSEACRHLAEKHAALLASYGLAPEQRERYIADLFAIVFVELEAYLQSKRNP